MAISVQSSANAVLTASRNPSVTFAAYTPLANDVIFLSAAVTVVAAVPTAPAGWINPLGGTVDVESDQHGAAFCYHLVTSAEQTAGTLTYTATNFFAVVQTGNVCGIALRGVDPAVVIDSIVTGFSTSNTATPHVLPALVGANLSNNSMVVASVASDGVNTYTQPTGWTVRTSSNTNQGHALLTRNTLTTAGVAVAATNITPSSGDEYVAVTVAFTELGSGALSTTSTVADLTATRTAAGLEGAVTTSSRAITWAGASTGITGETTSSTTAALTVTRTAGGVAGTSSVPTAVTATRTAAGSIVTTNFNGSATRAVTAGLLAGGVLGFRNDSVVTEVNTAQSLPFVFPLVFGGQSASGVVQILGQGSVLATNIVGAPVVSGVVNLSSGSIPTAVTAGFTTSVGQDRPKASTPVAVIGTVTSAGFRGWLSNTTQVNVATTAAGTVGAGAQAFTALSLAGSFPFTFPIYFDVLVVSGIVAETIIGNGVVAGQVVGRTAAGTPGLGGSSAAPLTVGRTAAGATGLGRSAAAAITVGVTAAGTFSGGASEAPLTATVGRTAAGVVAHSCGSIPTAIAVQIITDVTDRSISSVPTGVFTLLTARGVISGISVVNGPTAAADMRKAARHPVPAKPFRELQFTQCRTFSPTTGPVTSYRSVIER